MATTTGNVRKVKEELDKTAISAKQIGTNLGIVETGFAPKGVAGLEPFTSKLVTKQAGIMGIDPKSITTLEKFNASGQLSSVTLKGMTASGKDFGETILVTSTNLSRWQGILPGLNNKLNQLRWSMVNFMFAAAAIGVLASPFILATKLAMDFEVQLKRISAVTGKTVNEIQSSISIIQTGTPFSLKEVSTAYLEFTKAGFSAAEAAKAMPSILNLSISGFLELSEAGKITAQILHQFGLEATETARVVDVMSKAANISAADVQDIGVAMAYVGPVAVSAGISMEELAGSLAILSNAGLRGSRMGTNLRQALSDIIDPSEGAKAAMESMGISFYDSSGKMKSLDEIIRTLTSALNSLETEEERQKALGQIFDIRGATAINSYINLLNEGKGTIEGYTVAVSELGYANEVAAKQMEASSNQLKIFIENMKTALTSGGGFLNTFLGGSLTDINKSFDLIKKGVSGQDLKIKISPDVMAFHQQVMYSILPDRLKGVYDTVNEEVARKTKVGKVVQVLDIPIQTQLDMGAELKKWESMRDTLRKQGRVDIAVSFETALSEYSKVADKISNTEGLGTEEEYKRLGMELIDVFNKQSSIVDEITKTEELRYAQASALTALYDSGTDSLKYSSTELGVTSSIYSNILTKIKEINSLKEKEAKFIEYGKTVPDSIKSAIQKATTELSQTGSMTNILLNVEKIEGMKTAKENAERLFGKIKAEIDFGKLDDRLSELDKIKTKFEEVKKEVVTLTAYNVGYTMFAGMNEVIDSGISLLEVNTNRVIDLETAEKSLKSQLDSKKSTLDSLNSTMTNYKNRLTEVQSTISTLSSERFTGETEYTRLIYLQNRYLMEQKLAGMGVYNVQEFINNSLTKTGDKYNGLVSSMEEVKSLADETTRSYESWQKTIEQFIRSTITAGEDLGVDVTSSVKKYQTLLLGVTNVSQEKGTTAAEQNLEKLKLAYDYYYGGMKEDVKNATMEHEDSVNGVASGSDVIITKLREQWTEQQNLNGVIKNTQSQIDILNKKISDEESALKSVTTEISNLTTKTQQYETSIWKLIDALVEKNRVEQEKRTTVTKPVTSGMSVDYLTPDKLDNIIETVLNERTKQSIFGTPLVKPLVPSITDLLGYSKMANGGIVTSPTRALIGENGPEMVIPLNKSSNFTGGTGTKNFNITINVETNANAEEIAREVKREIMSL